MNGKKKNTKNVKKTELIVAEANAKDVGRRIARIDPTAEELLELTSGDVIEINFGGKNANVLNWHGYTEDAGKGLIRIDGYVRSQLDVGINDKVEIKKVEVKDAQNVTLRPTEPLRIIGAAEYLIGFLEGHVVTKGDIIPLSIMGQRIDLVVWSTSPPGPTIITKFTNITVSDKIAKGLGAGFPADF